MGFVLPIDNTASSSSPFGLQGMILPIYNIRNDGVCFHNAFLQLSSHGDGSRDNDLLLLKVFRHCLVQAV